MLYFGCSVLEKVTGEMGDRNDGITGSYTGTFEHTKLR